MKPKAKTAIKFLAAGTAVGACAFAVLLRIAWNTGDAPTDPLGKHWTLLPGQSKSEVLNLSEYMATGLLTNSGWPRNCISDGPRGSSSIFVSKCWTLDIRAGDGLDGGHVLLTVTRASWPWW